MGKPSTIHPLRRIGSAAADSARGFGLRRLFAVGAWFCCGFAAHAGMAEEATSEIAVEATPRHVAETAIDEEVVVRGRPRSALRAELRLAEDAVYSRFNEINSRDEFDILCEDKAPINSHISRRVCMPRFWKDAYADIGRDAYLWITGGYSGSSDPYLNAAEAKQPHFDDELRRLAAEDEELLRALERFVSLKQALDGRDPLDAPLSRTAWSERTPEDGGPLPYDAARIVNVEIGREPWIGALEHGTFTIAHLHGKIRSVELECDGRKARLRFKLGVEWRLPTDAGSCTVRVDAKPGSSFALYEFE